MGDAVEGGDVLIAVDTGDFLDEVDFAGDVEAMGGYVDGDFVAIELRREAEGAENGVGAVVGNGNAEDFVEAFEPHGRGERGDGIGTRDDRAVGEFSAGELEDELRGKREARSARVGSMPRSKR